MPEARPLSATSHWRSGIAAMFMTKHLRQCDGLPCADDSKDFAASLESPDGPDAGLGR
jgi:hypothetical protein